MTDTLLPDDLADYDAPTATRNWGAIIGGVLMFAMFVALIIVSSQTGQLGRLGWVGLTIALVLVGSAALFAASNSLVSVASRDWARYRGLVGLLVGGLGFGLLRGNRSIRSLISPNTNFLKTDDGGQFALEDPDLVGILEGVADPDLLQIGNGIVGHVEWAVVGALLAGAAGWATGRLANRALRVAVAGLAAVVAALLIASNVQYLNRPDLSIGTLLVSTLIGAVIGAVIGALTHHLIERAMLGAAVGAVVGGWLIPDLGLGSLNDTRVAALLPLVLLAVRMAWPGARTPAELSDFNRRARAVIFLGPALLFLSANLVVPAVRTLYTSFLDRESEDFVGLDNFDTLVSDKDFIDAENWTNIFTSQLFLVGAALIAAGVLIGGFIHRSRHDTVGFERTGGSLGTALLGIFLLFFAFFSVVRGTLSNTLWWVLTVTVVSTVIGLTVAVLAERAGRMESTAKSLIFMPMAVSFVGASIIWRFQYQPRNVSKNQTGALNALWIELGNLSHSGWPRAVLLVVLGLFVALTALQIVKRVQEGRAFAGFIAVLIVVGYLFVELFRRSLGGFAFTEEGEVIAETVLFREHSPFNNVFLMFILIWVQSGFAMVILSAAIKAVPGELVEAAKIDGADESQRFFYVVLPQILPTIGVVVTTLIVLVTKVFDIVKVSTGGNFGTNVLANDFFTESFQFSNRGVGSAIAVFILLTVAPVLIMNVRQLVKDA